MCILMMMNALLLEHLMALTYSGLPFMNLAIALGWNIQM